MGAYTNIGLVKHAQKALALPTKYMWGGTLYPITDAYINSKVSDYKKFDPTGKTTGYTPERIQTLRTFAGKGYYGVDCVCLIKSYPWSGNPESGGVKSPKYNGATDVNAGTMYNLAKVKGKISTMPEIPGLIVYSKSHPHVGIYIGNGYTIESTLGARGDGVVKRKLDNFWELWFECPFIEYQKAAATGSGIKTKTCTLAFPAKIRSESKATAKQLGRLEAGSTVAYIIGSDTIDNASKSTYVKIDGETDQWIVKSAIK